MIRSLARLERAIFDGELSELISMWCGRPGVERMIGRALKRNACLLYADPSLTLPAVYRLAWFAPDHQRVVRDLLDSWQREHDHGPWLRALRAPLYGLHHDIEEYFGLDESPAAVAPWFSVDGTLVGVRDPERDYVAAWSRLSGARIETEAALAASPATSELPDYAGPLPDEPAGSLTSGKQLPDGSVIAYGWIYDYDGLVVRLSASGDEVWRTLLSEWPASCALSPDGCRLLMTGRNGYDVLDAETGSVIGSQRTGTGNTVLSADQAWSASWTDGRVRVTPTAYTGCQRPTDSYGLVDAQFSPSGRLLLSGRRLSGGHTGALIAEVDVVSPEGFLEGGPLPGATHVTDEGVVEAGPFCFRRWNRAGERILDDPRRHLGIHRANALAWSGDGALYATAFSSGPVSVRQFHDDAEVVSSEREAEAVAFAPSGHAVAYAAADAVYLLGLDGRERALGQDEPVRQLQFSHDGGLLAGRGSNGPIIWDVRSGERVDPSQFHRHAHRRTGSLRGGVFEVRDGDGEVLARVPSDDALVPSPCGRFWAGRHSHFELVESGEST